MTKQNLEKIYDAVIDGKKITTKVLNDCGLASEDTSKLQEEGVLKETDSGYFDFVAIDLLIIYGKKLLLNKEYERGNACFDKCCEISQNNVDVCLSCFHFYIHNQMNEKAMKIFNILFDMDDPKIHKECNFYLFLLSFLIPLSTKYEKYSKKLTLDDMLLEPEKVVSSFDALDNAVKKVVFDKKFSKAIRLINEHAEKGQRKKRLEELITIDLAIQARYANNNVDEVLCDLIASGNYKEVVEYINSLGVTRRLNTNENIILQMAKDLLKIVDTKTTPEIRVKTSSNKLEMLIKNREYIRALDAFASNMQNTTFNTKSNRVLHKVLTDIVNEMKKTEEIQNEKNDVDAASTPVEQTTDDASKMSKSLGTCMNQNSCVEGNLLLQTNAEYYYGITSIFDIAQLVVSGTTIDNACQIYDLSSEQTQMVYLLFAREYYALGAYTLGDGCMKIIEKSKNKPSQVKLLYNEIKHNKRFYVTQIGENGPLALVLKGNK